MSLLEEWRMEDEVAKGKAKRACVDCHFLMQKVFNEYTERGELLTSPGEYRTEHREVDCENRNNIRRSNFQFWFREECDILCCYHELWPKKHIDDVGDLVYVDDIFDEQKRYKTIVETDRNDCCFFLEYDPEKNFKAAAKMQKRRTVLQSNQNKKQSNKTETTPIETTLSYYKTTGMFSYGNKESIPISPTSRHKVRDMAEKLMKWWKKGKPCPLREFGIDPTKKTPTHVYDNISDIRKVLEDIKVNMVQCTEGEYHPPSEPEHFNIEK
jgi:hypothetical protein